MGYEKNGLNRVPVLLLPMSLGIGGAETHVVSLAKHLSQKGWDVTVASAGGALVDDLSTAGVPHVFAPLDSRSPLNMLSAGRTIARLIDERNIGLVHAHARIPAWIAEKMCRKRGVPMVMTYHGTFAGGPFWRFFSRPGDATIAVSSDIKDYISKEFGFDRGNINVILNGIDLNVYREPDAADREESRKSLSVPQEASPVVLYESRLDLPLSGVAKATIDACMLLKDKYPTMMLLVGGDGEGLSSVKEHAENANQVAGREIVRCLGFLEDTEIPAYFASDLLVGMSRIALQTMSCSRAVVIAGPDGVFGPVEPGSEDVLEARNYTSRSAPYPLSAQNIADAIDPLLWDGAKRDELGRFGRQLVAARHSMDRVTELTVDIYAKVISKSHRKS